MDTNKSEAIYTKGQRVEIQNANGKWIIAGYATGRADARGIEVTAYPTAGSGGSSRTAYFHPRSVRPYVQS